jgi:hypothetical protein
MSGAFTLAPRSEPHFDNTTNTIAANQQQQQQQQQRPTKGI